MSEIGSEIPQLIESKPSLGSVEIPVGSNNVRVSWAEFMPEGKEKVDPKKAVVFFPGWPWSSHAKATWDLPRWLANEFGLPAYSIDTITSALGHNTVGLESEAIRQFIEKQNLNNLTIFGHSEGALKAAHLAVGLQQKNPALEINGVVLANPMGFYPQSFGELAKNFVFVEIAQVEPKQINPRIPHMPQVKVLIELLQSLWQDVKTGKFKYPWMFAQQMREMRQLDPVLAQIKSPVLILTTDKDFVSNYRRYLPEEDFTNRFPYANKKWGNLPLEEQAEFASREEFIGKQRQHIAERGKGRAQFAKEKIVPESENVMVIIASRLGSHIGLPVERYKQTAHVVSRIFGRLARK